MLFKGAKAALAAAKLAAVAGKFTRELTTLDAADVELAGLEMTPTVSTDCPYKTDNVLKEEPDIQYRSLYLQHRHC